MRSEVRSRKSELLYYNFKKQTYYSPLGDRGMASEQNIKIFTAADIEQYHRGLLSAKERHALEKAALDDPFLADALEGYAVAGVNAEADITELKKRLSERVDERKVIPINTTGTSNKFRLLRVAAIIVLVVGAGLLVYQFAFNNKSKDVTQVSTKKKEEIKSVDSGNIIQPGIVGNENASPANDIKQKAEGITTDNTAADKNVSSKINKQNVGAGLTRKDTVYYQSLEVAPSTVYSPQAKAAENKNAANDYKDEKTNLEKEQLKALTDKKRVAADSMVISRSEGAYYKSKEAAAVNRQQENRSNVFRGRITDANNNPVPFANVTNPTDNVGTYSDVRGHFNLTSPDSVLDVQIRSIGFENNNTRLRNNVVSNQVIMQDDSRGLSEVVINNKRPNTLARSMNTNAKPEEPEPEDGWENYDTYLVNNLNEPEEVKGKENPGDVKVSFEINKNGEPINIKVEKSLCRKCDEEAIRLIKEGPRWKRNDRKSRTTVTVPF